MKGRAKSVPMLKRKTNPTRGEGDCGGDGLEVHVLKEIDEEREELFGVAPSRVKASMEEDQGWFARAARKARKDLRRHAVVE